MKKQLLLIVMAISLFSNVNIAQTKLFLTKKSEPLTFKAINYQGSYTRNSISASVSKGGEYLGFALSEVIGNNTDQKAHMTTMNQMGVVLNMEKGEIMNKTKNSFFFFDGDLLLKFDTKNLWNNPFPTSQLAKMATDFTTSVVNPHDMMVLSHINIPEGQTYFGVEGGYVKTMKNDFSLGKYSTFLYRISSSGLRLVGEYPVLLGIISMDGTEISGTNMTTALVYNINSGNLVKEIYPQAGTGVIGTFVITKNRFVIITNGYDAKNKKMSQGLSIIDLNTKAVLKNYPNDGGTIQVNDDGSMMIIVQKNGTIKFLDLNTLEIVGQDKAFHLDKNDKVGLLPIPPTKIGNGKYFIVNHGGIAKLISVEQKRVIADIFIDEEDWAIIATDGRVDGTFGAFDKLEWRKYNNAGKVINQIPITTLFENKFTPQLLPQLLKGQVGNNNEIIQEFATAPKVKILSPSDNFKSQNKTVIVKVSVQEQGGGIDEIRLYHNGKMVHTTQRGFKVSGETKDFNITLVNGVNQIKATAFNKQRTEGVPDEITVFYNGVKTTTNLYMLVIGIDNYKNPKYKLNYALADAGAFKRQIELGSKTIFGKTEAIYLSDSKASKQGIITAFNSIKAKAQANDVFIFYYAGHGVMSEEENSEFYIIPYDVTQLYGNNGLLESKGVSAKELQEFSKDLQAQKQLFIFDACQSGGMVQHLAMRGAAEEKAIAQLARSTGTFWLAASNSEQFATEFSQLGHGLFTYTILQALKGEADGSNKDKKITVKEISAYLNDMVPELSQKYKGSAQYPNSYGYGQDFPVVIVK